MGFVLFFDGKSSTPFINTQLQVYTSTQLSSLTAVITKYGEYNVYL